MTDVTGDIIVTASSIDIGKLIDDDEEEKEEREEERRGRRGRREGEEGDDGGRGTGWGMVSLSSL